LGRRKIGIFNNNFKVVKKKTDSTREDKENPDSSQKERKK